MTASPTRPTVRDRHARPARRSSLLAASALCGVAAMLAQPGLAGTLPGIPGAANITVSSGGSQPLITFPDAITLQIDLNAPRTVINWSSLHLSSGDAMNFLFDASSDIVLNKTTSQIQIDSGAVVTGTVGAATAGNIWFYSPQGVIISPGATMTAGGFLFSRGTALNDVGFVGAADPLNNLRAATDALIRMTTISSATSASIDAAGNVLLSASSGALNVSIAEGATVGVSTTSGSITASEVAAASGAASVTAGGPGATVTQITGATGVTVSSNSNTSVGSATTTNSGDILITSNGSASLTLGNSARNLTLSAPQVFVSTIDAVRDVFITGTTSAFVTNRIFAGDDIEITADGDVSAGGAYLKSTGLGASDDAHILLRSGSGSVAADNTLLTQGTGTQAGDITIDAATTASVGTADSTRDLIVTASSALSLTDAYSAAGTASFTSTAGSVSQAGGSITAGTLTVSALSGIALTQAGNNVTNLGVIDSGLGGFSYRDSNSFNLTDVVVAGGDVSLTSASGAVSQSGGLIIADALSVTAATGIALNEDNSVASLGVLNNTTSGGLSFRDIDNFDITDDVSSAGNVSLFSSSGDITHSGGTLHAGGFFSLDASGLITVGDITADGGIGVVAAGDVDVTSATAGGGVSLLSNGGRAVLRKAVLTGSGASDNLSIVAAGDAVLGSDDYLTITTDNVFSRTGGSTGTAVVRSISGDALIHLDASAAFTQAEGEGVDVTISTGPASFGSITASLNDIYVEALDGALTIGGATAANGDVSLYSAGGDLTLTGAVHGSGLVHVETDGLLDGSLASLISSDGDLQLIGGGVNVGHIQADGMIEATAIDADAYVEMAEAGQTVVVAAVDGAATLRGAQGPEGVFVLATGKATFGADDRASITSDNYVVTDPTCGCGTDGLQVTSIDDDVVININSASNGIELAGSAIGGDVTVVQTSGDLRINEVAGYNITLHATDGTLEVGQAISSGGDYTVTAHDFLGAALTPNLFFGAIHDVTITDTLGDLNLGALALHADHWLTVAATGGAVTGAAQLDAGSGLNDGRVVVAGEGVAVDTIASDGSVTLDGGNGLVDVATSVDVWGNYALRAGDFANAALTPQGTMLGTWSINDRVGGFDFTGKTLRYGGGLLLFVNGVVNGGDITVDTGNIYVEVDSGHLGVLTAPMFAGATSIDGGIDVDLIQAGTLARVRATDPGSARLGAAIMTGAGATEVLVEAYDGDAILGAATPGAITAANVVTSTGASLTVTVTGTGRADVNLDNLTGADLTTVQGASGVAVKVANGSLRILDAAASGGAVTIDGPAGALTVDQLTALLDSRVNGGGDTRLVSADVTGDLTVTSATGNLRFGDATPGRVIEVGGELTLDAATDVSQQAVLRANALNVSAGTGVVLLGDNAVSYLGAVDVGAGGFAFHDTLAFDVYGPVNAVGQTVDLRSDQAIGQVSTGVITAQTLTGSSVGGANFGAANQVVRLGDFTNTGGGLLKLVDGRSLTISGAVSSAGAVHLTSHAGMTFASTGTVLANGTGDAVILASDGVFTNARGADAVTAASGRWLIYTQAVGDSQGSTAGNSFNGLAGKSFYGSIYDFSAETLGVAPNAGNRFVYGYRPTLTVTPNSQIVTYDGSIPSISAGITGLVNGDLAANAWSGAPTVSGATSKTVGTYVLTAGAGSLASDLNYAFAFGTGSLRIDPKVLSGVLNADDKIYDGGATATGLIALTGVVTGDAVSAAGSYAFGDKTAAAGKTVTASGVVLSGADAGNYTLSPLAAGQADIFRKGLTGALTANDKTYDGATTATGSVGLTGVVAGDAVTASGSYAFVDKTAAAGKTVTASGMTLSGADAANYDLGVVSSDTADIFRKAVTGTLTANDKTYDGGTAATGSIGLAGLVAGDTVTASGSYAFGDKTAAAGKTVTASGVTLSGADAGNYDLGPVAAAVADILRKALTGTLTANDKTYDGTTAATGSISLAGVVAGDSVSAGGTYAFGDKTAGADKAVTASGVVLSGADAANYDLAPLAAALADVLRKSLTGTLVANDKTYDGGTTATGSIGLTGVVAGDAVSAAGTYAFADKTAGEGKTVTAAGVTLSGADAANYDLAPLAAAVADILRKSLTGTLTADNKTYDGGATATGSIGLTGVVAGDAVTASGTYAFGDKTAGAGKTVTASGVTLSGAEAANYDLGPLAAAVADILRKSLTGTLTANDKTYDGATTTTGLIGLTGVVAGDVVTAGGAYAFADPNAGTGKTVTASGVTLSGADAANYSLSTVSTDLADVLRRPITVTALDGSKVYGQADPTLGYRVSLGALVQGEGFVGLLSRVAGEQPGDYVIGRGSLGLSSNYEVTFTGAVFTIRTAGGADGSTTIKHLTQSPDFTLDWDPEPNLQTGGEACSGDGCRPQAAASGGALVAALR